jgi:hypothetical protein
MKSTITASIHFSFKGENHSPSITVELDQYLEGGGGGSLPDLCPLIAKFNNHDLYSYEYEMMQAAEIVYSDAKGLVSEFLDEGILDTKEFVLAWHENNALNKLLSIAEAHMNITDFSQHIELKKSLLEAYMLGKKDEALNSLASQPVVESF